MSNMAAGTGGKGQKVFKNVELKKKDYCSKKSSFGVDHYRAKLCI
jgi:hypothetical protein